MGKRVAVQLLCPTDRHPLRVESAGLQCPECRRHYAEQGGIPDLRSEGSVVPEGALVGTLLAHGKTTSLASAVGAVCKQYGLARTHNSAEWKFMFPAAPEDAILELGAGVGEDTRTLSLDCAELVAVVPTRANAELLQRCLREDAIENARVVILDNATQLPWADASFGGIVLEDAAAPGFHLAQTDLPDFAKACCRVLRPGGCVCLGLSNPIYTSRAVRPLKTRLQGDRHPESLNRAIKREGSGRQDAWPLAAVRRAMQAAGFAGPELFAPLPDERQTKIVLPLNAPEALLYYFSHLVRRDSASIRAVSMLMRGLVRLGVVRRALPYWIALFRLPEAGTVFPSPNE